MNIKSHWVFFTFSIVAILTLVSVYVMGKGERVARVSAPPTIEQPLPDFSLTANNGSTVSRTKLLGNVWVADFIFTSCPGPCPKMTRQMKQVQDGLTNEQQVRFVSFTVNPEMDTPPVLDAYGKKYGAGPNWLFLTGGKKEIYALAQKGFLLTAMDTGDGSGKLEDQFIHSTRFAVVDRQGKIRAYFDGTDPTTPKKLITAVQYWLAH